MKVTQEKLPASQIGLEIEITPEMSKKAYEQVIQKFTKSANIPGFRKGKVPRQVIVQRFGVEGLKAAALEELIDDTLKAALQQEKIEALGNFQLRSSFEELVAKFEPGAALTFSAAVDVQPEVVLKQYSDLQVQAEQVQPDPERVNRVLQEYQEQSATLVPVEGRAAQLNDVAVVDFEGVLKREDPDADPEPVPGGRAQDFQLELIEDRFIPGFVTGMIGMQPGETREVTATFPENYPQATVAGREASFTVTLKELKEKELPELDDDFAQEVSEFETLAELQESLEQRFNEEAADKTRNNQEQAILDELLNHIEVDLPETLIDREVSYMLNQTAIQLQNQGIDVRRLFNQDTIAAMKERSRPDAIKRLKRTLALGEIAKQEKIEADEEAVNTKVTEILSELEDQDLDQDRLRSVIAEDVLKEKIMDWLIEHATIELVPEGTLKQPEAESEAEIESAIAADEVTDTEEFEETQAEEAIEAAEATIETTAIAVEAEESELESAPTAIAPPESPTTKPEKKPSKATNAE